MKKILQNALVRSLIVLIFGVLLLVFSKDVAKWIVCLSGGLFVVLGALALINYYRIKDPKHKSVLNAIIALGSVLFGVVQIVVPDIFVGWVRYLMAGLMFLLALFQLYSLISINKGGVKLHWAYSLVPLVGIGLSLLVMFYKGFTDNDSRLMIILGIGFVIYALLELWTIILVKRSVVAIGQKENFPEEVKP